MSLEILRAIRRGMLTTEIMIQMMSQNHPMFATALNTYDFTQRSIYGETLLVSAIMFNKQDAILQIIEKDTQLNAIVNEKTALVHAIQLNQRETILALLQKPVVVTYDTFRIAFDMNMDQDILLALFHAIQNISNIQLSDACIRACRRNYVDFIKGIQIQNINNIQDADGNTLLTIVSVYLDGLLAEYFLSKNVNLNIQNNHGDTALILAVEVGNKTVVEKLLQAGANKNLTNIHGETALTIAQFNNDADILQLLNT